MINKAFSFKPVTLLMAADAIYTAGTLEVVSPEQIFGMELEIERFKNRDHHCDGFNYTNDGSLRENGIEAVSYPTKAKYVQTLLEKFFKLHKITPKNYTERCSTHIHMNVQDMTFDNLKTLATVYQTVERLLFNFVGNERDENPFCVPWYQSGITPHFIEKLSEDPKHVRRWMKYSALNFLPISSQGTVEFRHMHGTCDVLLLITWMNLLSRMQQYSMIVPFEKLKATIMAMNTVSNYDMFLNDVFKNQTQHLLSATNYKDLLSVGVVDSKLMFIKQDEKDRKHPPKEEMVEERLQQDIANILARERARPIAAPRRPPLPGLRYIDGAPAAQQAAQPRAADAWADWRIEPARRFRVEDRAGRNVHVNVDLIGGGMTPEQNVQRYIDAGWIQIEPNSFQAPIF